jgi:uncharacterized membrane protein YedE/YeeE
MAQTQKEPASASPTLRTLGLALVFGVVFGFLLQKGGVAKFHLLVGVLLLHDFTVVKVMVSAIIVGMIGVFTLRRLGRLELNLKPTRLGANIIGGLIFGFGFACSGYCPGTGAVALGQGNWDALFMMAGMMAGSYLFALHSGWLSRTVDRWGDRGKIMLPSLLRVPTTPFIVIFAALLAAGLWALETWHG